MPVKLPVFCLVACVRMRYFTCAHQPRLTGPVMWREPLVTDSLAPASSRGAGPESQGATEPVSRKISVWMAQVVLNPLGVVTRDHPGVVSEDTTMFGQIVQCMTAPFRRKAPAPATAIALEKAA